MERGCFERRMGGGGGASKAALQRDGWDGLKVCSGDWQAG